MADAIKLPPLPEPELFYWKPSFVKGESIQIKGYTEEAMHAYAASVSAAKDAEIAGLRERVRVLEDQLRTALTIIGHPDDDIIKAMRDALEQKP